MSRYQRKGALVSESTPHSPEPTRKGLRGRSGQVASSPSPRSARIKYIQDRAQAVRRSLVFKSHKPVVSGALTRPDLRSAAALRERKRLGLPAVNKAMRRAVDRDEAIDFLAMRLPDYALAKAVGYGVDTLHNEHDKVMELLRMKGRARDWDPRTLRSAGNALDGLFRDLELQGIRHYGRPQAGDISWHLKEYRDQRREIMAKANAEYAEKAAADQITLPNVPRMGKKRSQQGVFSGQGRLRALKWVQKHAHVDLHMEDVFLDVTVSLHRSAPEPAIPITVWMLCMLELFCVDPTKPLVMRVYAAGILICCYGCLRFAQAQDCYFSELHAGAMFSGFVFREKAANPAKRIPRPFWGSLHGVTGVDFFSVWQESVRDVPECRYIFGEFDSTNRLPSGAVYTNGQPEWLNAPMPENQLMLCIQEVLRVACCLSHAESIAYTNHSARHTLQCSGSGGDEPDACRHEIGKWSSSTAQLDSMRPTDKILQRHTFRLSLLPDLYSKDARHAAAARVLQIMYRQVARLRTYVQQCGGPLGVPKFMDWNTLPKFKSAGTPADE